MPTPEGKVKAAVKAALQAYGVALFSDLATGKAQGKVEGFFFMPVAGRYSVMGIHDFVGCWNGVFFTLETKAPDEPQDATHAQRAFYEATTQTGGVSFIGVRDASVVERLRERVMEVCGGRTPV